MLNKFVQCICFASLVLLGVATISCGGSSASSARKIPCTGGPYNVVGVWGLEVNGSQGYLPGVINSAGLAIFFEDTLGDPKSGSEVVMPSITGACSFSENLTYYVTRAVLGGGEIYSDPVQGTVQSDPAIDGTISETGGSESFVALPLSGPIAPTALNSSMTAVDVSSPVACLTPGCLQVQVVASGTGNSANMTLSGTDGSNCDVTGTFKQEGSNAANLNVFDVSFTFTGTSCQVTGTITGLGFESTADYFGYTPFPPTGTFLYVMSSNSADVFEIYP